MVFSFGAVLGLAQLVVTLALAWWGAWLGRLRGGAWRHLVWLPIVAFLVSGVSVVATAIGLVIAFQSVASADPSEKASLLADGISRAMAAGAGSIVLSFVLDAIALIACAVGTVTRPREPIAAPAEP